MTNPDPPRRKRTRIVTVTLDGYTDVAYRLCTSRSQIEVDAVEAAAQDRIYAVAHERAVKRRTDQLARIKHTPESWIAKEAAKLEREGVPAEDAARIAAQTEAATLDTEEANQLGLLLPVFFAALRVDSWEAWPADVAPGTPPAPMDWDAWLAVPKELVAWIGDERNNRPPEPIDPNSAAPSNAT